MGAAKARVLRNSSAHIMETRRRRLSRGASLPGFFGESDEGHDPAPSSAVPTPSSSVRDSRRESPAKRDPIALRRTTRPAPGRTSCLAKTDRCEVIVGLAAARSAGV